ncbi:MAG: GGDEF domain-containing protein [Synergistaceae bacterium]|nr:GGDEF domain-containing protein [Synergistaceae bacterium]
MIKRENLFKLLVTLFILSLALNCFLLFRLAPRKALLKEIEENKTQLAQSQRKRKCVPGSNFLKLFPFLDEVKKSLAETKDGEISAVISLDGDKIGTLVKEKGDDAADYVIEQLSNYIEQVARENKDLIVAKLGERSDEIVIFVPNRKTEQEITDFATKLLDNWRSKKLKFNGEELHVTISAGIALYPKHATDCKELYTRADVALQQAKDAGRDRYVIFEEK